jgi:hypothetical protein
MKTIFEDEFASYLFRAKKKMENPDATVDPLSQVIVASKAGGRGTKRGRITPHERISRILRELL